MGTLRLDVPPLDYPDHVARLRARDPELAEELVDFTGIGQVVEWFTARGLGKTAIDMVAMDEFEYDFLVELPPDGRWLAFGVT